jgi:ATP-dependent protease ClpP protease subunit
MTQQTYPIRCRIRAEAGVTRVDVYDDIGGSDMWSEGLTAKAFAAKVTGVKGSLEVHINSGGGEVFDGIAIGNAIRAHKGPVTTVVDGIAASIASVIMQAGQERVMQPGAMMMIHDASGLEWGNAEAMAKMAKTLDQVSANLADIYAERCGGDADGWRTAMRAETWFTAEEAVTHGLADRVGDGTAELPAGMDLTAFTAVPGRIAARLRAMPQAAARPVIVAADGSHAPMSGSHAHSHPAFGSQGGDGSHGHDHGHDGDADHDHPHAGAQDRGGLRGETGPCCPACGPDCACMAATAALTAAAMHGDHQRVDPDGDGDCDACPEGDTDHDYWSADGKQIQPLPAATHGPRLMTAEVTCDVLESIIRDALRGILAEDGGIDNTDWDASKAWHNGATAGDPAAFYAGICAGRKTGDKTTQDAWALPYKYTPSSAPNAAGVRAALGRLDQTDGLTNHDDAQALLQRLMKRINPDYDPDDHDDTDPGGISLAEIRAALKGATR